MTGEQGSVVADRDVAEIKETGDTAATRVTIDARVGSERLEQRLIRFSTPHIRENSGSGPMRVLGVFHPSGDPASRAREEPTG